MSDGKLSHEALAVVRAVFEQKLSLSPRGYGLLFRHIEALEAEIKALQVELAESNRISTEQVARAERLAKGGVPQHEHERWQILDNDDGELFCGACGGRISADWKSWSERLDAEAGS